MPGFFASLTSIGNTQVKCEKIYMNEGNQKRESNLLAYVPLTPTEPLPSFAPVVDKTEILIY